jgi:hypothetical protein
MCWYRVRNEDSYADFDTFEQAKHYYDLCLKKIWQEYKEWNILEDWEEDKQWFDLSIVKMETVLSPAD